MRDEEQKAIERRYQLTKEIFLKTPVSEYLNNKNKDFYIGRIKNAKRLAELFLEEFEKEDVKDQTR